MIGCHGCFQRRSSIFLSVPKRRIQMLHGSTVWKVALCPRQAPSDWCPPLKGSEFVDGFNHVRRCALFISIRMKLKRLFGIFYGKRSNTLLRLHESLLTDFYQLSMLQAYYKERLHDRAVFEFFVRKLPANRNFFVFAGLEQLLEYISTLSFSEEDLSYLANDPRFKDDFLEYLRHFSIYRRYPRFARRRGFFPE